MLAHPLAVKHKRRGITPRFVELRKAGLGGIAAFLAVLGPGMLAGLSDDDPAGITTYSVLGAEHGYRLLWIIPASTILLIYFHLLAVRIGAASGKGFVSVIRERWGAGLGYFAVIGLLFANFGTSTHLLEPSRQRGAVAVTCHRTSIACQRPTGCRRCKTRCARKRIWLA